jgi:hypothetical protein
VRIEGETSTTSCRLNIILEMIDKKAFVGKVTDPKQTSLKGPKRIKVVPIYPSRKQLCGMIPSSV